MAGIEEIRAERLKKIALLKDAGRPPYPNKVPRDFSLDHVRANFLALESAKEEIALAGRVMAVRGQGAIQFVVLNDGTGKFQAVFKKDTIGDAEMELFGSVIDVGDFISVSGELFVTQRGEESVLVKSWVMGTKSLLPLPEKWHGLQDEDEKLRKRYLDILFDDELRELFVKKSKFWNAIRSYMIMEGFLEVETPTIEVTTGGAEARPFQTHHNDFDLDVYMRICVGELWQKRLMAAGFPRTFEIGRAYRNEGSSPDHLQEFTNCEFYMAYADFHEGMRVVKELYRKIATEVFGTTKFTTRGHTFDLNDAWVEIDYTEEVRRQTGIDIGTATDKEIISKLESLDVRYEGDNRERLIDTLWKYCRKNISGPAFLVNHPLLVAPLSKENMKEGKGLGTAQIFQPILGGSELGKGYSELNDPIDQRKRFEKQQELLLAGDDEAMQSDDTFLEMLEHGMPPTCGFGFGERLFAFFVDRPIREIELFPLMRPK